MNVSHLFHTELALSAPCHALDAKGQPMNIHAAYYLYV